MSPVQRLTLFACLLAPPASAQVVFPVSFDASASGLTSTERANITSHVQEAGKRWVQAIGIAASRSIEIEVRIADVPTANATSATTGFVANVGGRDMYEQGAAFELRTGTDPNGATADAYVTFGLAYLRNELWFDPAPAVRTEPVPVNRTDALSVALHELGHVFVYNGWADLTTGQPPATYWSTFDRWMQPGAPTVFIGATAVRSWGTAPDVTTGNNKHWGNATALAGLPPVPMRVLPSVEWINGAPTPLPACQLPESIDAPPSADATGPRGGSLIDQLMNGVVFYRGTRYDITPLDRATLIDTGVIPDRVFANGFDP
ncbi:MAG: hypothetical protein J0L88_07275 [Xanthomonadales bacterium]|nr:hypothetical protein [Xanthomonadales bacterium]